MRKQRSARRGAVPTQRQLKVGEELRHALVRIVERAHFHDPDLAGASITVTEVRVGPDLRTATAFVMPLGGRHMERVVAALNRAAGYFRREIGNEIVLRYVPEVAFAPDTSFDYSTRIDEILQRPEVARDLPGRPDVPGPRGEGGRGA